MKLKFLLLLFIFTLAAFTQYTHINLSMYDGSEFKIDVDNTISTGFGNYAEFRDLTAGEHHIVVTKNNPLQVIYDGKIKIPVNTCTYAVIDEYGAFVVYRKLVSTGGNCLGDATLPDWKKCGPPDNKISEYKEDTVKLSDDGCMNRMKDADFNKFLRSIGNLGFERTNLFAAKETIDKNFFTSAQVREILSYFKNEDNKLDIAKHAYPKTCDKSNYSVLFNAFNFDESITELKNFINSKK